MCVLAASDYHCAVCQQRLQHKSNYASANINSFQLEVVHPSSMEISIKVRNPDKLSANYKGVMTSPTVHSKSNDELAPQIGVLCLLFCLWVVKMLFCAAEWINCRTVGRDNHPAETWKTFRCNFCYRIDHTQLNGLRQPRVIYCAKYCILDHVMLLPGALLQQTYL